jgi:predicted PurR-regulated permease PerM
MAVLGINGFIVGPAIAAMFMALWHIQGTLQDSVRERTDGGGGRP